MLKLLTILLLATLLNAQKMETTKTVCIQQSAYAGKTLAEQKKVLIEQAKQESLEELYGTLIASITNILDGRLVSDEIKSRAVGSVRVKGDPSFSNGKNLGEICANVTSYITPADIKKYSPQSVKLKHFCFNDTSVSMKNIKNAARLAAYKEMLIQYKPSLKNISQEQAEDVLHSFKLYNDKYDFNTGSYCFDAKGTVLPYELEMRDFSDAISSQQLTSKELTVKLKTNKKSKIPSFKEGEEIELFIKMSKVGYYYIVGYTQLKNEKYSYLLDLRDAEGDDKFVMYVGSDEVNKWVSLGAFTAQRPFGTESLQVMASNKKLADSLPRYKYDDNKELYFISKDIQKTVYQTRAIGKKKSKTQVITEATLSFKTSQ